VNSEQNYISQDKIIQKLYTSVIKSSI